MPALFNSTARRDLAAVASSFHRNPLPPAASGFSAVIRKMQKLKTFAAICELFYR